VSWREYVGKQLPGMKDLGPDSETLHLFNPKSGEAVSTPILYTLDPSYMRNPQGIYDQLKICIDAVADYAPRSPSDLPLAQIKSKTIHLAVPYLTSPVQWRYLHRAERYAESRNVSMRVTRIRD
jgi:filamentous hemagglutinin